VGGCGCGEVPAITTRERAAAGSVFVCAENCGAQKLGAFGRTPLGCCVEDLRYRSKERQRDK
ncbi:unnamed protein product, partial [Ilex paraguariensis]